MKESLVGTRCTNCDTHFYPARSFCPYCHLKEMSPHSLSKAGRLYSYSIVHIAPEDTSVPYAIGYVDLPEGLRLLARLEDFEDLGCDASVELQTAEIDGEMMPVAVPVSAAPGVEGVADDNS